MHNALWLPPLLVTVFTNTNNSFTAILLFNIQYIPVIATFRDQG
jgi:hypothetical protein